MEIKQDFWVNMIHVSVNAYWMKVYAIQSKNEIMINVGVSVKNQIVGVLVRMIICGIRVKVIVNLRKHVKLTNI